MDGFITSTLAQLASQLPVMLVCLAGLALALIFFKRLRRPSIFTLIGAALLLLTTIIMTLIQNYLIFFFRDEMSVSSAYLSTTLMVLGILGNILRAAALALILTAVFTGRPKPAGSEPPVEPKI
jgi:drug/metabolite transporter (DMT)-like permease